jgi:hypothetical protein
MDDETKGTLALIEREAMNLELESKGRQLVFLAFDFLEVENFGEVRRLLRLIDTDYFMDYMPQHLVGDQAYSNAVARLIEVLGVEFWLFSRSCAAA